ncbi:Uncharacterised protein [uncultured archaeon]|nr:Uncharacterised protein [uncultured archaeon]
MGKDTNNVEMNCTENESGDGVVCKLNIEENGKKAACDVSFKEENKGFAAKVNCSGDPALMKKLEERANSMHIDV